MYLVLAGCRASSHNLLKFTTSIRWASTSQTGDYKVGDVIHGYKLEQVDHIRELNIRPYYLKHETTGAEHLHIHKEGDSNNVFSVALRTTPKNSTGVPHILEHLALSGSKKYAVHDPFFKMLTRSLATFMNAMTSADCTFYPFSTQNKKDFENLLNIYTDAVFFPRLRPVDFRREGWRLEHEKPDKKDTPFVIRGVVYNEMKGVFSSSSSIYDANILNNLFPDTTYKYESGGDPEQIPNLTHEELKRFHKHYYHPSNAKFFTYGDLPFDEHLKLINENVMSKFSENAQAREQSIVQEQEPWDKARTVNLTCPLDPLSAYPDKQTTTSISYLLATNITNFQEMFSLQILSSLLIDGPNAPFYKSLKESGLGADFSPSTGLNNYTKQPYFSIGLQNIHSNDIAKVHEIIEKTLRDVAVSGFPSERVDALLHNIELSLKHVSGNFGLRLLMSLGPTWNHEGNPIDFLKVNQHVERFKKDLANDKHYWGNLIRKYFLSNSHKLTLNMSPDTSFEKKRNEREKALLDSKVSSLNEVDRQTLLYEGMELMKISDHKDDPTVLPCLDPSKDISKDLNYKTELKFDSHKGVEIQMCEQPTNEVVYFRALSDVGEKLQTANLIDYLPLFCDVATRLGAGSYNRHEFSQKMQLTTGGLGATLLINPSLSDLDTFKSEILLGSHCLRRNVGNMFELWANVFKEIHFPDNKEYLHQLIKAAAADLVDGIPHSGQLYAMKRSSSNLSRLSSLDERLSGLSFVAKMKDIASKESIESIASKLQSIASIAFNPFNMKCALNSEPEAMQSTADQLKNFIDLAQKYHKTESLDNSNAKSSEVTNMDEMKFSYATHYVAKSFITVPKLHEDFPKLVIMCKLISMKYLLREVREKGGAYGAGARVSHSGVLNFFSYRDPNTANTLQVFDTAAHWLTEGGEYTDADIEESKLGVFQDVDRPVEPGKRGLNFFTLGETDEIRQDYRRRLLKVTKEDVKSVASKYLTQIKSGTFII